MGGRCALSWNAVSRSSTNRDLDPSPDSLLRGLAIAVPTAVALAYALGHLGWYLGTPLGRVPVLDEAGNLSLANEIARGRLHAELFYRAQGYSLFLAGLRAAGVTAAGLFPAALVLGALLHAAGAALAASIARRWFGGAAAMAAGLLFALDPVLVHFATQALDTTLSLTLFLAGLCFLSAALAEPGRASPWALAGIAWAAATLVRPNYLLAWAAVPLLALFQPSRARTRAVVASLAGIVLFCAYSLWQWSVCGVVGFLPWQGPYNLWAANRPGANGRFYMQHVSLPPEVARLNPARAESILDFEAETRVPMAYTHFMSPRWRERFLAEASSTPPAPPSLLEAGQPAPAAFIAAMNAHWRARFLEEATSHPGRWAALLARKAYALLDNWEQYNNKTFAFHKARSPWLRWNPICFGLLLVLGVAGAARLAAESPRQAAACAAATLACAASALLFFASDRFRLPLAGVGAVLAGGALAAPGFWRGRSPGFRAALGLGIALAAGATFSDVGGVQDRSTYVQDHALLARAAYTVGDDETALSESREALKLQPWHPDALAIEKAASDELAKRKAVP